MLNTNHESFFKELADLKSRFEAMEPELELTVSDPKMNVEGFVVVWNTGICKGGYFDQDHTGRGCGKGGTRIMKDLSLEDVKRLAKTMAEKNAAAGLDMGGAKSGLNADPNASDYEKKYRRFIELVKEEGVLYEDGGVFGGFGYDIGGKPPLNAIWACDTLNSIHSFTGKPVDMGGTDYDKVGIAGLGVAVAGKALCDYKNLDLLSTTFAVQGLGAMGGAVVHYFHECGPNLKAVGDPRIDGTWVFDGTPSEDVIEAIYTQDLKTLKKLLKAQARHVSKDPSDVLYQDVDVLFPCALEDSITKDNVEKVIAPYIIEGANNPTTTESYEVMQSRGQVFVPDILANPGGIIAAYVELTSSVSIEENIKTRAKVKEAMQVTRERVTQNVIEMLKMSDDLCVRPDFVAQYMTYKNIFKEG